MQLILCRIWPSPPTTEVGALSLSLRSEGQTGPGMTSPEAAEELMGSPE
jgi:hypothetical protein